MGGQRQAVGARAGDGYIVGDRVHLGLHGRQSVKPALVAGFLPGQTLNGLHHREGGKRGQHIGTGEEPVPLFILAQDGVPEGMNHQDPLAGQSSAPGMGVIVGFQRPEPGKAGALTATDDLPLGAHIPQRQQVGALGAVDVKFAETGQRPVIGGKDAGKVAHVLPGLVAEIFSVIAQVFRHGAHLGGAAAAKEEGLAGAQRLPGGVVALLGGQNGHPAVFPAKPGVLVHGPGQLNHGVIIVHGRSPPVDPSWPAPSRHCWSRENAR